MRNEGSLSPAKSGAGSPAAHGDNLPYRSPLTPWPGSGKLGRAAAGISRVVWRLGLRLFAGRRYWHNRRFDHRLRCLPDEADPCRGFIVWQQRHVVPVTLASAGPGIRDAGSSCNLIASGPSILAIPARQRLLDRYSVVVNGAHAAIDRGGRKFSLYVVTDPQFVRQKWDLFVAGLDSARIFAADHRVFVEVLERDPRALAGRRLILFNNLRYPYLVNREDVTAFRDLPDIWINANGQCFSANPSLGFFPADTVIYICLQLLCGWRFRDILIFGMDLDGDRRSYVEAVPAPSWLVQRYKGSIEPSLQLAAAAARARGISIWNCSPVSVLPETILPKLAPEQALEAQPDPARIGLLA